MIRRTNTLILSSLTSLVALSLFLGMARVEAVPMWEGQGSGHDFGELGGLVAQGYTVGKNDVAAEGVAAEGVASAPHPPLTEDDRHKALAYFKHNARNRSGRRKKKLGRDFTVEEKQKENEQIEKEAREELNACSPEQVMQYANKCRSRWRTGTELRSKKRQDQAERKV